MTDISGQCGAVVEREAEVLRSFKGEPVTISGVFAEGEALIRVIGVGEINGKVLALSVHETHRFRRSLGKL